MNFTNLTLLITKRKIKNHLIAIIIESKYIKNSTF